MLAAVAAGELIVVLYYVDMLFSVAEKAGAAIDRRLIELMAGVPGIEHHERPEYLDRLDVLREERARLAWMTNAMAGMVRVAVQLVASGILLAGLDPILLLLPLVGIVSFFTGRRAQDLTIAARERTAERERLRHHLFETATSAVAGKEVRVFGLERELLDRHHAASTEVMQARDRAEWHGAALQAVGGLCLGRWLCGRRRAGPGAGHPWHRYTGRCGAGGGTGRRDELIGHHCGVVRHGLPAHPAARRTLPLATRFRHRSGTITAHQRDTGGDADRLAHGIDLRNITFQYPGTEKTVLEDVSLHLPAGSVVALVGENGAGKTTLVKLLCRFYEPTSGTIELDGIDLRALPIGNGAHPLQEESSAHGVDGWRSRISTGFQDFAQLELLARETVGVGDLPHVDDRELVGTALDARRRGRLASRSPAVWIRSSARLGRRWTFPAGSGRSWRWAAP